jgi:hypothetical protein
VPAVSGRPPYGTDPPSRRLILARGGGDIITGW